MAKGKGEKKGMAKSKDKGKGIGTSEDEGKGIGTSEDEGKGIGTSEDEGNKEEKKGEKGGKLELKLKSAAISGKVELLKELIASESTDFFLPGEKKNIFHIAAREKQVNFFKEAMNLLPLDTTLELLAHQVSKGYNPLHYVVSDRWSSLELVQIIVGFYKTMSLAPTYNYSKPWLAHGNTKGEYVTPFQLALKGSQINEDSVLEILSLDFDHFCSTTPVYGEACSLLYFAIQKGLTRVALQILNSSSSYTVISNDGYTPLHFATNCSGEVLELLLKKHPEMIDLVSDENGSNVLHTWATLKNAFPTDVLDKFPEIKTKFFTEMIYQCDNDGCNALHRAAANEDNDEIARIMIQCYQDAMATATVFNTTTTPWREKDYRGNTALLHALQSKNEHLASYILSLDTTLCHLFNHNGESPLYVAVAKGCDDFVHNILNNHDPRYKMAMFKRMDGSTVLHNLYMLKGKTGMELVEEYWWMMNLRNDDGLTALDEAKKKGVPWLVELLSNPNSIKKEDFNWAEACENNETQAVVAFIESCQDLVQICEKKKDTPLHYIKLDSYERYSDLLKIPSIAKIKNIANSKGDTPLHQALDPQRKDIYLAKALLSDKEVLRAATNKKGQTATKLLQKLHKDDVDWKSMCEQIEVDPFSKTGYITDMTNLGEMRTTLSVIAALLATITFAAGFTLPGGLEEKTGKAKKGNKAAFLVFLISDTYAMCKSMLVLFLLIWSMVSNRVRSRILIDRSVFILMQALYGTMVAFMTGIYLVLAPTSLWATLVVIVMCSFTGILISVFLLHRLLKPLIPTMKQCFHV